MADRVSSMEEVTLVDLLDRVLDRGVVVGGDVVLSVADIDLVYLNLRVLLMSVETMREGSADLLLAAGEPS